MNDFGHAPVIRHVRRLTLGGCHRCVGSPQDIKSSKGALMKAELARLIPVVDNPLFDLLAPP